VLNHRRYFVLLIAAISSLGCGLFAIPKTATVTPAIIPSSSATPRVEASPSATLLVQAPTYTQRPVQTAGASATPTELPIQYYATPLDSSSAQGTQLGRGQIYGMDVSQDGQHLVVGTTFGIYLYEADTFEKIWFQETNTPIYAIAFSPNGSQIAYSASDGVVWIIETEQRRITASWGTGEAFGPHLAWSPDGSQLALMFYNAGQVQIIKIATGEQTRLFVGSNRMWWSPDGKTIATGRSVIDFASGDELFRVEDTFGTMMFSPDGNRLVTSDDTFIQMYNTIRDAHTGEPLVQLLGDVLPPDEFAWSPDGRYIASAEGSWEGGATLMLVWDAITGQQIFQHSAHARLVRFGTDNTLYSAAPDSVVAWDIHSGEVLRRLEGFSNYFERTISATFSPDGKTLALGTLKHEIILWDIEQRERIGHVDTINNVQDLRWLPDGNVLLGSSHDRGIVYSGILWDVDAGLNGIQYKNGELYPVVWSPDGSQYVDGWLYTEDEVFEPRVRLHDTAADSILWEIASDGYSELAWSSDERLLALATDKSVEIWDATRGQALIVLPEQESEVETVAWLPDNSRIITGTKDGSIVLWNALKGEVIDRYDVVGFLPTISPDGTEFAYATETNYLQVRRIDNTYGATLIGHRDKIIDIAWSADGSMLVTVSDDTTVILWSFD
jgi:WD40 repeat protein